MHGRPSIANWIKNDHKIDPKWSPSGPGGRQGVFENQLNMERIEKNANAHTQITKNMFCFNEWRFLQKLEGSTDWRLPIFLSKRVINMLYKTWHNEAQQKQSMSKCPSKKCTLKNHGVPTAR